MSHLIKFDPLPSNVAGQLYIINSSLHIMTDTCMIFGSHYGLKICKSVRVPSWTVSWLSLLRSETSNPKVNNNATGIFHLRNKFMHKGKRPTARFLIWCPCTNYYEPLKSGLSGKVSMFSHFLRCIDHRIRRVGASCYLLCQGRNTWYYSISLRFYVGWDKGNEPKTRLEMVCL